MHGFDSFSNRVCQLFSSLYNENGFIIFADFTFPTIDGLHSPENITAGNQSFFNKRSTDFPRVSVGIGCAVN